MEQRMSTRCPRKRGLAVRQSTTGYITHMSYTAMTDTPRRSYSIIWRYEFCK